MVCLIPLKFYAIIIRRVLFLLTRAPMGYISEYVAKSDLNVVNEVTGRVKGHFFLICHSWLRREKEPHQNEKADGTSWI